MKINSIRFGFFANSTNINFKIKYKTSKNLMGKNWLERLRDIWTRWMTKIRFFRFMIIFNMIIITGIHYIYKNSTKQKYFIVQFSSFHSNKIKCLYLLRFILKERVKTWRLNRALTNSQPLILHPETRTWIHDWTKLKTRSSPSIGKNPSKYNFSKPNYLQFYENKFKLNF